MARKETLFEVPVLHAAFEGIVYVCAPLGVGREDKGTAGEGLSHDGVGGLEHTRASTGMALVAW